MVAQVGKVSTGCGELSGRSKAVKALGCLFEMSIFFFEMSI